MLHWCKCEVKVSFFQIYICEYLKSEKKNLLSWNGELKKGMKKFRCSKKATSISKYPCWFKGVSSKPSGNLIVVPNFCFLANCLYFNFLELCKVSVRLDKMSNIKFAKSIFHFYFFQVFYSSYNSTQTQWHDQGNGPVSPYPGHLPWNE